MPAGNEIHTGGGGGAKGQHSNRRPCSDFMDMLWHLINCCVIIIIINQQ